MELFKKIVVDVIETTLLKDGEFEDLDNPKTMRSIELVIEACLWRWMDGHDGTPEVKVQDAEDIIKEEWPLAYQKYKEYKYGRTT